MEERNIEDVIAMVIADALSIKVMLDDMPDTLPITDQYRIHAISTVTEDLISRTETLNSFILGG